MTTVVTVFVAKGGATKTTTSAHLVGGLALRGYATLGIDLNPQAHLCASLGVDRGESAAAWVMGFGSAHLSEMAVPARPNAFVLPADDMLTMAEAAVLRAGKPVTDLRQRIRQQWDGRLVVIDTSDHGYLSEMAIAAADIIVVPVPLRARDVSAFLPTIEEIKRVRESAGLPTAKVVVVPTMHDRRNNESQAQQALLLSQAIQNLDGYPVGSFVASTIGVAVDVDRAGQAGKLLWEYDPHHERVREFRDVLVDDLLISTGWTAILSSKVG